MLTSRKFIVILGDDAELATAKNIIKGFKAVTVIKTVSRSSINNIYHFNKSPVFFTNRFCNWLVDYNPFVIQLTSKTNFAKMFLSTKSILTDFPKLLESHGIDCGDHICNSTESGYVQPKSECLFCKILAHTVKHHEHILYESDNFFVIPGTGAFFDGYIMVIPKKHVMSFANLSKEELEEFFIIYDNLSSILERIYGKKVFGFECGSGKTGAGKHKTSIVHCHFHMAATDMPVLEEVQKSGLTPQLIDKKDLIKFDENPYMLYVDQNSNWFISCDNRDYYPRQHPRQVLAHWMLENEFPLLQKYCKPFTDKMTEDEIANFWKSERFYNWRNYPMRNRLDTIADEFRTFCKENFDKLLLVDQHSIRLEDDDNPTTDNLVKKC